MGRIVSRSVMSVAFVLGLAVFLAADAAPAAAGAPPSPGSPTTRAAPGGTFNTAASLPLAADSPECAALKSRGATCGLLLRGFGTVRLVGNPISKSGPSANMAGTTNYYCLQNSCNGGQGDLLPSGSCGQQYSGTYSTYISDSTGYIWWSSVSYRYHGMLCQSVYFDSVDCSNHGGNGTSVSIDWCGSWNNGGASPYFYADAGDNITVSAFVSGFPISAGHWQRFGIDVEGNWGISFG